MRGGYFIQHLNSYSEYLVTNSPDTQVGDEGAAPEEDGPDVVHHDGLDAPVGVQHGERAEHGVSHRGGPEEGDDYSGNLDRNIRIGTQSLIASMFPLRNGIMSH